MSTVLCCLCGTGIEPNPANMCLACLKTKVDISEGIPRLLTIAQCPKCARFQVPPSQWIRAEQESRELLGFCLRRLHKRIHEVRLVNAQFLWTEPHSKRLRIELTIQRELYPKMVLQQQFPVDYHLQSIQCTDCCRIAAKDYWQALVQVRQEVPHKRTLIYLEQMISRHKEGFKITNIKTEPKGINFYFAHKIHALSLVEFIHKRIPCRYSSASQLKSHDIHNNTFNTKTSYSVEVVPLCKNDVICLSKPLSQKLSYIGPFCVVSRVTDKIHLIDPQTGQVVMLDGRTYFANPISVLARSAQLSEYLVLDSEKLLPRDVARVRGAGLAKYSPKHELADFYLVRSSQLDSNEQIHCRSHLGNIVRPNDTVLGLDLVHTVFNNDAMESLPAERVPDVIVVYKPHAAGARRNRKGGKKAATGDRSTTAGGPDDTSSVYTTTDGATSDLDRDDDDEEITFMKEFEQELVQEMANLQTESDDNSESAMQADGGVAGGSDEQEMDVDVEDAMKAFQP